MICGDTLALGTFTMPLSSRGIGRVDTIMRLKQFYGIIV